MVKKLISVIIPVYNIEKYIKRCIESVCNQTYKDLEIIVVNDGSTDNSCKICMDIMNIDSRIVLVNKKNGGLADARNAGLKHAHGEYISFVDGDDYIEENTLEIMLNACETKECQIAVCGRYDVYKGKRKKIFCMNEFKIYNKKNILKVFFESKYMDCSSCDKLFHKSVIEGLFFPKGKTSEDLPFVYNALKKTNRLIHVGMPLYYYCHRNDSISGRKFSQSRMDYLIFLNYIKMDLKRKHDKEIINYFYILYSISILYLLRSISESELVITDKIKYKVRIKANFMPCLIPVMVNPLIKREEKIKLITTIFFNYNYAL